MLYSNQDYKDDEVLELDDMEVAFTLEAADSEGQGSDSMSLIQNMITAKADLLKIDFYNLLFPFSRIEAALSKQSKVSPALLELRLSSCKILP